MTTKAPESRPSPPYSIGRRLSVQLAVQTVIGLGVLLAFIHGATTMLFTTRHENALRGHTAVLIDVVRDASRSGGEPEIRTKLAWLAERHPGTFVRLLRADGSELYRDPSPTFDMGKAVSRDMAFTVETQEAAGALHGLLTLDRTEDARTARSLAWLLVAAVLLGAAMVGWGTFWRVRHSLRPLMDLAAQTQAIDARHLGNRLLLDEPVEELQPVIDQFNGLMQRVETTYAQLEGFNADVAHELRTPLANLIGHTEVTLSRERSVGELEDTLHSNLEELHRMAAIVNDMLFLAQADRGVKARRNTAVKLAELVQQVVEFHEAPLEERSLSVIVEGDSELSVDEALIKRALSNLLGNAIRYAQSGSALRVRIQRHAGDSVQLWVENTGPTIGPEHLPKLFDRFFRADLSRGDTSKPHHGLGLSIVAAIARMHDGFPAAQSQDGVTRIGFSLHAA